MNAFACAQFKDPKDAQRSIGHALDLGYRAIDTAFIYNNQKTERAVGA
jgi:diketogulonate reductase-like aldo/keto reductase